jgi:hypothetical protein
MTSNARETLPLVKVKVGGKVYDAGTGGRLNAFCTVFFRMNGADISYEYSWAAIERYMVTGKPLTV